jgi:excinuclease UvrABC nuclease subunit
MNWKSYDLMDRAVKLPRCAGVYAIYFDGLLVYIGQSVDIANRFSEHKFRYGYNRNIITPWINIPDTAKVIVKIKKSQRHGDWAMWEIRLIRRLSPIYNRQHRSRKLHSV